jgi:hypothetical protein
MANDDHEETPHRAFAQGTIGSQAALHVTVRLITLSQP